MLARLVLFDNPGRAGGLLEGLEEPLYGEQIESIRTLSRLLGIVDDPSSLSDSPAKDLYLNAIGAVRRRDFDTALVAFIGLLKEDRYYDDDGSRKACIAIFKFLGEEHELTQKHRREFSRALYV